MDKLTNKEISEHEKFLKKQNAVLENGTDEECYQFVYEGEANIKALCQRVAEIGGAEYCYSMACIDYDFDSADIKALQAKIIASEDANYIYYFARDVDGADKEALQDRLIDIEDSAYFCYLFANNINGADIPALQAKVIKDGTDDDCYNFARNVVDADMEALLARVEEIWVTGE